MVSFKGSSCGSSGSSTGGFNSGESVDVPGFVLLPGLSVDVPGFVLPPGLSVDVPGFMLPGLSVDVPGFVLPPGLSVDVSGFVLPPGLIGGVPGFCACMTGRTAFISAIMVSLPENPSISSFFSA